MKEFTDLPFSRRPDLSPYLIHLTKNSKNDGFTGFENLVNILETGEIWGSSSKKGFIKGANKATCFMDIPLQSLKYVLTEENKARYQAYGVLITKQFCYSSGVRPVLYLADQEIEKVGVKDDELWRVVRLEVNKDKKWISWLHEREWRAKGDFKLPKELNAVFVRTPKEAEKLQKMISDNPKKFKAKPLSIIPLSIVSQGLVY